MKRLSSEPEAAGPREQARAGLVGNWASNKDALIKVLFSARPWKRREDHVGLEVIFFQFRFSSENPPAPSMFRPDRRCPGAGPRSATAGGCQRPCLQHIEGLVATPSPRWRPA